jgi:DNA invertase Pin-like site-specific DNA recombinase
MKKVRVACSVRVSHEEQVKDGFSIQTQIDHLKTYIEKNKELILVDFYIDEGVSADKLKQRTEMQRLLQDVKDGKVDMILFTKLDRWFRSVEKYYQVQSILDQHNVTWKAILEDYETETASGRFKVNIMLSVAQQERERTSERIKDVFQYKVKNGEALYGSEATPFGFEVVNKRMIHNKEEEELVKVLLNHYYVCQSVRKTVMFAQDEYGVMLSYPRFRRLLSNTMLYGSYRDNDNYCEPYITKERFDEIQAILKKNIRVRKTNNEYIFSGMITCPICGCKLIGGAVYGKLTDGTKKTYLGYRCESHFLHKNKCTFNKYKSQAKLESQLMEKLQPMLEQYVIDCSFEEKKKPKLKKIDRKKVQEEMDRLNTMYLKGRINEEMYDSKYIELNKKLVEVDIGKQKKETKEEIQALVNINLEELYNTFDDDEKRTFLRGIIKEIKIDKDYNITDIIFL